MMADGKAVHPEDVPSGYWDVLELLRNVRLDLSVRVQAIRQDDGTFDYSIELDSPSRGGSWPLDPELDLVLNWQDVSDMLECAYRRGKEGKPLYKDRRGEE